MTWAEFQIRAHGYNRIQEREDLRAREIAWTALIGSHANPKKLPKTKENFWSIGKKAIVVNTRMQDAIKKAQEEYFKKKKELNG
jgi:hypothetical protein